jgi:hypothetical protein
MASTIHNVPTQVLLKEEELKRVSTYSPALFERSVSSPSFVTHLDIYLLRFFPFL